MKNIQSFEDFINENYNQVLENKIWNVVVNEDQSIDVVINEGFLKDLQNHIREVIDHLINIHNVKANKIDKVLDQNLEKITKSFKDGKTPEETAEAIA